ncbi:MAG: EAL domain-containing protein [Gammaproteobacteria bacterium]
MWRPSTGLRTRLLLLVLAALIPAFGLIGYTAIVQRGQAVADAERDAMNLVRLAAREQSQLIASTHQLLMSLAQLPVIKSSGGAACNQILADLLKPYPYYANFGAATAEGRVYCSAIPLVQMVDIADRGYFQRALNAGDFGIGDYQIGRITGLPAINFGYPVRDADGSIRAVVYAALNLSWLNRLAGDIKLPAGSTVTVVDSQGTILARYPDAEGWVGMAMGEAPLIRAILGRQAEGTVAIEGLDGEGRLYAFAPLHNSAGGNVYVSVGIPKAVAFATVDQVFARSLTLLLLVALLALAAAWVGSDVFVLRRVKALCVAAQRLAKGDLGARTGLPHSDEELGRLARNFDDMASELQKVHRALRTLSAGNRTLVRATDEQALLDQMCRIIVEVGGYPFAWVGYVGADTPGSIRPVAQAGYRGCLVHLDEIIGSMMWTESGGDCGTLARVIRFGERSAAHERPPDAGPGYETEEVRRSGHACIAVFPLEIGRHVIGALSICSWETDSFDAEEMRLLEEAAGDLAFGIGSLRTRAAHDEANDTIRRMMSYDSLTGLPNHIQFEERLQHSMAEADASDRSLALQLLDLDRFQEINDALGFRQGDRLLKEIGARVRDAAGTDGFVARLRGDEFAILLPAEDVEHITRVTRRILSAFESPFVLSDIALEVSAAVGIALYPQHGTEMTGLIRKMDVAMRQAKSSGERYAFYAAERDEDTARRLVLAQQLRHAIKGDELVLYYQPKVDLRGGRICGMEALVRWVHPEHGLIPPDEFISLAEHTGLIKPLTDWVLRSALRQSSAWRQAGLMLPIAVNLSARNLRERDLPDKLRQMFQDWSAHPSSLELEITESAIMDDPDSALKVLTRLNDLGSALFIDDFGTGYSSLGYLQRMPVEAIKIDKSFVKEMVTNANSAAIVRSTITLAHDLGIKVVAEGVESREAYELLAELGCDVAQGYQIGKPMPAAEFETWVSRSPWSQFVGRTKGR